MMTIGQFAQASGLTVKALHFYDDRGVLAPAEVDPASGYRRYRPGQLREAGALQALRAADVPLDQARRILDEPDRADAALDGVAAGRAAARERQDRAFTAARRVLDLLGQDVPVGVRDCTGGEWTGLSWPSAGDVPGDGLQSEVEALSRALHAGPEAPTGPMWTTFRADGGVAVCFPTDARPERDAVAAQLGDVSGLLTQGRRAPGTEAWTRMSVADLTMHGEIGVPPVALVALGEYLDDLGGGRSDDREVRQVAVPGADGEPIAMEFVAALPDA